MEQLMVYFVFTYFCGAVYDEQAYGKLKFAVAGCILIRALAKGVFLKNGTLEFSDVAEAALPVCKRSGAFRFQQVQDGADAAG